MLSKIEIQPEIIVATDRCGAIGKNNRLLWHLPADLKFFKETTIGHVVVMGRKTFESIGKPLPGRMNVVLSRATINLPGITAIKSLQEIYSLPLKGRKIFIIGGAEIYSVFLPIATTVHHTWVDAVFSDADTFFPIEKLHKDFLLTSKACHDPDDKNPLAYCFQKWIRKK